MNFLTTIPLIPQDKKDHFVAGLFCYLFVSFFSISLALICTVIMAVGKEIYDYYHKENHTPEIMDAVATCLGGLVGILCGLTFNL